uniref:Major sperm protein n=1 Tax=Trichuris muris TaxID=70415 RepID=A0A5S6QCM5_TRIMR
MGYLTVEPTELLFYSPCRWRQTKKLSLTNSGGANVAVKVKTTNDQVGVNAIHFFVKAGSTKTVKIVCMPSGKVPTNEGRDRLSFCYAVAEDTGGQSLQTFWESERNWHKVQVILMFKPVPSRLKCPRKGAPKTTGDDKAKRAQSGKGKHTVEKTQEDRAERMHKGAHKVKKTKTGVSEDRKILNARDHCKDIERIAKEIKQIQEEAEKEERREPTELAEIRRVFEEMKKTVVEEEENRKQESAKIEIIDDHLPDYQPADTAADEGRLKKTGEGTCGRQQDDPGNKRKERTNSKVPRKGH